MPRTRRGVWLCTACKRCRRYTCLQSLWRRMWCARCQTVTVFRLEAAKPRMGRNLPHVLEGMP
jgi:hypothetical protein